MTSLLPGVHAIASPVDQGFRTQGYVLEGEGGAVLVDVTHPDHLTLVPDRVWALVLTHRHTRHGEALYEARLGSTIYLLPPDARLPRAGPAAGTPSASRYHDPRGDRAMAAWGLHFIPVPGHTPGHCLIYWPEHGGVLLTGDAVIGPRADGAPRLEWPPPPTSDDDALNRASVSALELPPFRHLLPLHGDPLLDLEPDERTELWRALLAAP